MRYMLTLTGLPKPSTRALCGNAPDVPVKRGALVCADVPDGWLARIKQAVRDVALVPADQVAQEINGLSPRTVQGILRAMANEVPAEDLRTMPFGATSPAWGSSDGSVDDINFAAIVDYSTREIRAASVDTVDCVSFDDLAEWAGS